jgi:putative endonuclease
MSDRQHSYWVYLLASKSGVLYVGVTNDLERRVWEHKNKAVPGFTADYNVNRLVWCEEFREVSDAIAMEKRIKGWSRAKKVALIQEHNPQWNDLSEGWYKGVAPKEARDSSQARNDNPHCVMPSVRGISGLVR